MSGGTNEYVVRTLQHAVPLLEPDFVLVVFTDISRRDYLTSNGLYLNLNANLSHPRAMPMPEKAIVRAYREMLCHNNDVLHFAMIFRAIRDLLKACGVRWAYSWINAEKDIFDGAEVGRHFLLTDLEISPGLIMHDTARDFAHPGPNSMQAFVDSFISHLDSRSVRLDT
jgi:hypothetical protein